MSFRPDLYTNPHKELREYLFKTSILLGCVDFQNKEDLGRLEDQMALTLQKMRNHARSESTYAHPIIGRVAPDLTQSLEEEHVKHFQELDAVERQFQRLCSNVSTSEKGKELVLEFYRSFNRFLAHHLSHLDEEEYFMQNLWELCTKAELFAVLLTFKAFEEPESFPMIYRIAKADLSEAELENAHSVIRNFHGEDAWTKVSTLARSCQA